MVFLYAFLVVFVLMTITWIISLIIKNPSVVDVAWPTCIGGAGLTYLYVQNVSTLTIAAGMFMLAWGLRLGGYLLWTRIIPGKIDPRYLELSQNWQINRALGFFFNYQLQGILTLIIALPYFTIGYNADHANSLIIIIGFIIAALGLVGECAADWQLDQFKREKVGPVCNIGLWRYSRHPNYFCDWLVALGVAIIGLQNWFGLVGLISPLTLYIIMVHITGPMTEQGSLQSRGGSYRAYQEKTPMFFPKLFQKNRSS